MSNRPPAFQWYPKDWLSDKKVKRLSYEAKGVYIELLCLMWNEGKDSITDDSDLAKILGIEPERWLNIRSQLQKADEEIFIENDGKLISARLKKERIKQNKLRRLRSKAGKASGKARQPKQLGDDDAANSS